MVRGRFTRWRFGLVFSGASLAANWSSVPRARTTRRSEAWFGGDSLAGASGLYSRAPRSPRIGVRSQEPGPRVGVKHGSGEIHSLALRACILGRLARRELEFGPKSPDHASE